MKEILLSIIIPAYNCEKYIGTLLESIFSQNLSSEEYEIIVVNDGSTDNTFSILQNFSHRYDNLHIISQSNQGRHAARNNGESMASGKYIWFIDNDDLISKNCLKGIINTLDFYSLDILVVAPPIAFKEEFPVDFDIKSDISDIVCGQDFLLNQASYWAPWQFVIRRDFYQRHEFKFRLKYFLEDIELMYRVFYYAKRIARIKNFSCYAYIRRPESETMNPWTENKVLDYGRYINYCEEFIIENHLSGSVKELFEIKRTQFYLNALNNWKTIKHEMPLSKLLNIIHKRPSCTYGNFIERVYQMIAIKCPRVFVLIKPNN